MAIKYYVSQKTRKEKENLKLTMLIPSYKMNYIIYK